MSEPRFVNRLKVGPTVLEICGDRPSWISLPRRFRPFQVAGGNDIAVEVRRESGPRPGQLLFESGGVWRAYAQPDGSRLLTFRVGRTIYKSALLDRGITRGTIFFPRSRSAALAPKSALEFPLDEMLFQQRWAHDGLLEVHACGIKDRGGVLLFTGQSGAGKSTTARLWSRVEPRSVILSDDRILLDPRGGDAVRAFGTPWHGTARFGSPGYGRLKALFFLEQAGSSEALPIHPAQAAARLFTRTFPPIWDREMTERVMSACADVAERIPAFILRFTRDETAIAAARRAGA